MVAGSEIVRILKSQYRDGGVTLAFKTPFQLLVATVLSAQCTDERVNSVTPALFDVYGDARSLAAAPPSRVKEIIRSLGFFNQKARHIQAAARMLAERFAGEVPADRDALQALPGVGRKTANIVLSRAFGVPAIAVDTHVRRVSRRLFAIETADPDKIEIRLMEIFPRKVWNDVNQTLIFHGREVCISRKPRCGICPVTKYCNYFTQGERHEHDRH